MDDYNNNSILRVAYRVENTDCDLYLYCTYICLLICMYDMHKGISPRQVELSHHAVSMNLIKRLTAT